MGSLRGLARDDGFCWVRFVVSHPKREKRVLDGALAFRAGLAERQPRISLLPSSAARTTVARDDKELGRHAAEEGQMRVLRLAALARDDDSVGVRFVVSHPKREERVLDGAPAFRAELAERQPRISLLPSSAARTTVARDDKVLGRHAAEQGQMRVLRLVRCADSLGMTILLS